MLRSFGSPRSFSFIRSFFLVASPRASLSTVQDALKAEIKASAASVARNVDPSVLPSPFLEMPDPSLIKDLPTPDKIKMLVEVFSSLSLVEAMLFSEAMKKKLGMPDDLVLTTRGGFASASSGAPAQAGGATSPPTGAAAGAAKPAAAAPAEEQKTTVSIAPPERLEPRGSWSPVHFLLWALSISRPQKFITDPPPPTWELLALVLFTPTHQQVDIKLKSFKAESKIKAIKEVRVVTNLGLKEVRPAPLSLPAHSTSLPLHTIRKTLMF